MTRVEQIGDATLYLGDCRDVLPTLGAVDAVITDPPYGLKFHDEKWDEEIPDWLPLARAAAPLVMFTTAPTTLWDYPRPDWVCVWYRPASSSRNFAGGFNHWSPIAVYGKVKPPVDVVNLHAIANAYPPGFGHPSPKPLALMEWLVGMVSGVVCDPFMGSGTTGAACATLGRSFIGIERDPDYYEMALDRISEAQRQGDLLRGVLPKAKQEAML